MVLKMIICCAGYSAKTHVAIVFLLNVISNSILLQNNTSEFPKLKANDNELSRCLILFQTILSLLAIATVLIFKKFSSNIAIRNWIQVVLFGSIFAMLAYEILGVILFSMHSVHQGRDFSDMWKDTRKSKTNQPVAIDFQIFMIIVSIFYFVFKLHAATVTFVFAGELAKYTKTDGIANEELNSGEEVVILNSSSPAPPAYESCFKEIKNMHLDALPKVANSPTKFCNYFQSSNS